MSALSSVCITSHKVRLAKDAKGDAYRAMREYMAREGRFREPVDRRDKDDRAHVQEIERMHDYYARVNAYEKRGRERPLVRGEKSGACFCRGGAYDHAKLADGLMRAKSNVVTSVVAVRRADAYETHMDRQSAFEELMRSHWDDEVASWGLIEPKDIEWCAFYHVDGKESLHVHVVTWDKSGRWGKDDERLIPKERVRDTGRRLNEAVIKRQIVRLEREKGYLRDAAVERIRLHLGRVEDADRTRRLEDARQACKSTLPFCPRERLEKGQAQRLIERVRDVAPNRHVVQYARSPEEVRRAAQGVVEELRAKDKTLDVMFLRHERIAESLGRARRRQDAYRADSNGVLENELRAYVAREKYDLQKRAASAVCSEARADGRMRDRTGAERERQEDARAFDRGFPNGLLRLASALGRAEADEGQGAARSANALGKRDAHGHIARSLDSSRDSFRGR